MSAYRSIIRGAALLLVVTGCSPTAVGPTSEPATSAAQPSVTVPPGRPTQSPDPRPTTAGSREPLPTWPIDPATFATKVDNPWFPLVPGTTLTYQGTKDGKKAVDTVVVTALTKVVAGVKCVVVEDSLSLAGVPAEHLLGYYAQDSQGNVWYFGEDTQELENGQVVGTEGSWRAGVDKAPPALFLEASPAVGDTFAHDYTQNDFAVSSLADHVSVPFGSFDDALVTREWSPLEPSVEVRKYYVRGVGLVRDVAVKGPVEELFLVSVTRS
jgi:hypothetical protein